MKIMTRMGAGALRLIEERGSFVKAVHSVGAPLEPGQADVAWPCSTTKYFLPSQGVPPYRSRTTRSPGSQGSAR